MTIANGLRSAAPQGTQIDYIEGFDVYGNDTGLDKVLQAANNYDVIVAAVGEHVYAEAPGDIHDIRLAQGQIDGVKALAATNKPVVTVLVEGRPRVLESIPDHSQAILHALLPGPWGGQAIGEVLFGLVNPSGKLPYTYPKNAGDMALNYWRQANDVWDPLYEFGHGLSYSQFNYSQLTADDKTISSDKPVTVSVQVTNNGPMDGMESVLMFIQQPVRRVTPPAKLLKGFKKLQLANGETATVNFEVSADAFKYTGLDGVPGGSLDAGPVKVMIGDQEIDLDLQP